MVTKKTLETTFTLGGSPLPPPPLSSTARNRNDVQVIVRKDHRMRLSFLCEQLVRSSEQLVLVDTKEVFRPCSKILNDTKRRAVSL